MGLKMPESMDECLYFSNRSLGENETGKATAWAYKVECPKCKKAKMGKPVVKGKVKMRAKEYVCPECGYTEEQEEHEKRLTVQIQYTCPECGNESEAETSFLRQTWKGVKAFVFECDKCKAKLGISKKMAKPKKPKSKKK